MGRSAVREAVHDIPGADPEVLETIDGLLSDDPQGFLAGRQAERLEDIQQETRQREATYYAELRKQTLVNRVASALRGRLAIRQDD